MVWECPEGIIFLQAMSFMVSPVFMELWDITDTVMKWGMVLFILKSGYIDKNIT